MHGVEFSHADIEFLIGLGSTIDVEHERIPISIFGGTMYAQGKSTTTIKYTGDDCDEVILMMALRFGEDKFNVVSREYHSL